MHGLAQLLGRALLAGTAALLSSCSPLRPALLLESLMLELDPGETAHVVLHLNDVALAEADLGLFLDVDGTADGTPLLEAVPDDPSLESLVTTRTDTPAPPAPARVIVHLEGGDLRTVCPPPGECDVGVTLALSGNETPASFRVRFGARRSTDRGPFDGSGQFSAGARADVFVE